MLNSTKDRKERIGRILQMHANHREDKHAVFAGDIVAAVGLKFTTTGDTLCDPDRPIILERMEFPEPVISVAIEPKTKADQDKLGKALARSPRRTRPSRSAPTRTPARPSSGAWASSTSRSSSTGMMREFTVAPTSGKPQVAYRETITEPVRKVEQRYIRQTGGRGQYGHVVIDLEPTGPGGGYEFVDKIIGGVIPREYIPAVDAGMQEALESGVLAGYPMVDIRAILTYGSYHDVDSSEMAFKIAGLDGLEGGGPRAKPALLEPIMAVEVVTPEDYMGDVIGDLSSRRGQSGRDGAARHVTGGVGRRCPLSEMFGYATDLRSRTQGHATYTMQFHSYQQVPESISREIIARVRGE